MTSYEEEVSFLCLLITFYYARHRGQYLRGWTMVSSRPWRWSRVVLSVTSGCLSLSNLVSDYDKKQTYPFSASCVRPLLVIWLWLKNEKYKMTICMIVWYWAATIEVTAELLYCHCARHRLASLSRRFILTHLIYTHIHITMPALDLHYIWALGHAITVACSCVFILFFSLHHWRDTRTRTQLTYSIRHFPNGLIPFNPPNDL